MKIRQDFVTNSSSSSFVIAKNEELSIEQEQVILQYVKNNMFGKKIASTKKELDKYYMDKYYVDVNSENFKKSYQYRNYEKTLDAINKGLVVYGGLIDFECCDWNYAALYKDMWKELEKNNPLDFICIDTNLEY